MASRKSRQAGARPARRSNKQVNVPRGNARTSARTSSGRVRTGRTGSVARVGSPSRSGQMYRSQTYDSTTPRVSSVKVGAITQGVHNRRAERRYRAHMAKVASLLSIAAVLVGACIGVYWSGMFAVKQVTVSGVEHLTSSEMTQLANIPSDTTLLRVDTRSIESNILRDAWVADVNVQRVFPDTLNLAVTEREIGATVVVSTSEGESSETWAISEDGLWLCLIPDPESEAAQNISPKIYEDAEKVFCIKDVAYGVVPEVGTVCTDASIVNALDIVTALTTELKDEVKAVSATSTENTTLTLQSNVEIAFGPAEDIRDKERVCLQIMADHPGKVSYINVRVVDSPTFRATA